MSEVEWATSDCCSWIYLYMTVKSLSAQKSGKKGTHSYRNLSYRETGNILLFYQQDLYYKDVFR